jgi:hypothetical protein
MDFKEIGCDDYYSICLDTDLLQWLIDRTTADSDGGC